jgi:hypothetical protein
LLLCQLYHIRQSASVQDYVDKFIDLVDQLSAYTTNLDTLSCVTRFIDGLRDDIHSVVLIQRLDNLDAACSLALLQEEAVEPHHRKEYKRLDAVPPPKPASFRGLLPLPPPPLRPAQATPPAEDRTTGRSPPRTSALSGQRQAPVAALLPQDVRTLYVLRGEMASRPQLCCQHTTPCSAGSVGAVSRCTF